uniref:Uncharacterized protein n=1 Tax=Populus alba TaxID=43335 RepID=A0A4U5Q4H7_POPAL|nr:hypothetical protein D5086_0000136810 [Populus alba]
MASLQASSFLFSSSCSCSCSPRINAAVAVPKLSRFRLPVPRTPLRFVEELNLRDGLTSTVPLLENTRPDQCEPIESKTTAAAAKLYAILEAVSDRVEMHKKHWGATWRAPLLALKISSTLLFSAATGMFTDHEQNPAFTACGRAKKMPLDCSSNFIAKYETTLALRDPTALDVKDAMEKTLALDKAYPLPLLGKMIEKFPENFEPAVWWPKNTRIPKKAAQNTRKEWVQWRS